MGIQSEMEGREEGNLKDFVGRAPHAFIKSQMLIHRREALLRAICLPIWFE